MLTTVDNGDRDQLVPRSVLHLERVDAGVDQKSIVSGGVDEFACPHQVSAGLVGVVKGYLLLCQRRGGDAHLEVALATTECAPLTLGGGEFVDVDAYGLAGPATRTARVVQQDPLTAIAHLKLALELGGAQGADWESHGEPRDGVLKIGTRACLVVHEQFRWIYVKQPKPSCVGSHGLNRSTVWEGWQGLRAISRRSEGYRHDREAVIFHLVQDLKHEVLAPGVALMALGTPTLPPATTTNTLIVGHRRLAVIEPASPYADEQRHLEEYVHGARERGAEVAALLVTHHHRDHVGHVARLREELGAPVMAHKETAARVSFRVDQMLEDGDVVELDAGHRIRARHTPGHAPGHLVFIEEKSEVIHVGDMLAGVGTILIEPGDGGNMGEYLDSLRLIRDSLCTPNTRLVPAHGPVIERPKSACDALIEHRLRRESKVLRGVETQARSFDELLALVYEDTPQKLWPLAALSLEAHLQKLIEDGRITRAGAQISSTS